jgi:hypothetical protein
MGDRLGELLGHASAGNEDHLHTAESYRSEA